MRENTAAVAIVAVLAAGALTGYDGGSGTAGAKATGVESVAAGAAKTSTQAAGDSSFARQKLSISTSSFSVGPLQRNAYDPFMTATGYELIMEDGKGAERVTRIRESPANYDVVIIRDAFIAGLIDAGLVEAVDNAKLTNLDTLYDIAKAPFDERYGSVYTSNRLGIVYDRAATPVEMTRQEELWSPDPEDFIAILGITATTGPLFYYFVAKMIGLEPGKNNDAIFAKLAELKPNVARTCTSASDTIAILNQSEISVAVLLDYPYTTTKEVSEDYAWVGPAERGYSSYNTINIVESSESKELVETFIDFYTSKEAQPVEVLDGVDPPVREGAELAEEQSASSTYDADMVDDLLLSDWPMIDVNKTDWAKRWGGLLSVK